MTTFVLVPGGRHGGWWFEPVAVSDVAEVLAEIATGPPQGLTLELAGPETHDLVDMARRTLAARGDRVRLIPSWREGCCGTEMAGEASSNCGKKAKKNSINFGFRTFERIARQTIEHRTRPASVARWDDP